MRDRGDDATGTHAFDLLTESDLID